MNPAELNKRITIQRATITRGAAGSKVETWADLVEVWAKFTYQTTGKESETAGMNEAVQRLFIRVRYYPGLNTADRIKFKNVYFDIITIREQHQEFLDLLVEERGKIQAQ